MTRLTTTAMAVLLAGGAVFAQSGAQTTGQTTAPPKPPATQTPQTPAKPAAPAVIPEPQPFPAGATVAYVQLQGVIAGSKYGRCGSQILNDMKTKDQATVAPKQKELADLEAKMQSQQGVLTEAAMTQMKRDHDRIQLEGQALAQQLQSDEDNKNQDLMNDFNAKIFPLLETLRKEKDLQFIFSADVNGAIVAANTALDLTAEVVKRLDAAYPECKKGGD
jgi:Skp family chaperone for outer membrane proteins